MQKFISIDIPTKPYIKAYIIHKLGEMPIMTTGRNGDTIGHKLYDLLQHKTNECKKDYSSILYTVSIRIRIPKHTFKNRGHNLNETNLRNFNLFIEKELKEKFHFYMNEYQEYLPNIINNLPAVRKKLGIDDDAWAEESMIKDYQRYRIYKKTFLKKMQKPIP